MKILTSYPIYYTNQQDSYSNLDDNTKKALVGTGIATASGLLLALANKQKQPRTDVEQKCGKKPWFGKAKKQAWQDCVSSSQSNSSSSRTSGNSKSSGSKMSKNNIIAIALIGAILIGGFIYLKRK